MTMEIKAESAVLTIGKSVVAQESSALAELAGRLDEQFCGAVTCIVETRGRVIVTGIGKSGHIARKIAATLAATGSPAFFVHPAEAAHGDLGMVLAGDTLVVLSNSGSTAELRSIVSHARLLGVPIVAVVSNPHSPLGSQADFCLTLPGVAEACPVNIAPTTSTTMMVALGDALAIAAMQVRGVSQSELMQWHPGGNIGWRFLPVDSLLRSEIPMPLIRPDAKMRDAVFEMTSNGKGVVGVVDDDCRLIGIITDGDIRRSIDQILIANARAIMNPSPVTVPSGTTIADVQMLMNEKRINVIFVMDANDPRRPVGLVHFHDMGMAA